MRPLFAIIVIGSLVLAIGCRTIRRTVDTNQSIEARRLSREGLEAIDQEHWVEAEEMFAKALQLSRRDDRAYWGYSEVLWHKGERAEAIKHMEQAVRLSAGAPEMRIRLGKMYLEQGLVDAAVEQAKLALQNGRDLAQAWALTGDVLVQQGMLDDALASYHRAIPLDRECPDVRLAIADIYKKQSRFDRVLATVDRIGPSEPSDPQLAGVAMFRGIALRELGQPEAGCQQLYHAIALGRRDEETFRELAATEFVLERFAKADQNIRQALELNPNDLDSIRLSRNIQIARQRMAAKKASQPSIR